MVVARPRPALRRRRPSRRTEGRARARCAAPPAALAQAMEPGEFQVAFVTRLQSMYFTTDSSVLVKQGRAESLQATEPGVFLGLYRGRVLLNDPETDLLGHACCIEVPAP